MSLPAEAAMQLPPPLVEPYRHEQTLFRIVATVSLLFWIVLTLGTIGIVWLYMLFLYLFVLFAHSALISYLKGNAVRIDESQFPDLHARIGTCSWRLGVPVVPEAYLMTGDGMLNAFATRFLRRYYIVLLSDVVDALEDDPAAINFYIGHELGHIHRKHIANGWWMGPGLLLPLLGAAYRRAQEYSCDASGRACCPSQESATRALAVLAAGTRRWKDLNIDAYVRQCGQTGGFWMSVNELGSDYPWLCKRVAQLHNPGQKMPSRHPLAWLLNLFIPRLGLGPLGPALSLMMVLSIAGMLGLGALMSRQDAMTQAEVMPAFRYGDDITKETTAYYKREDELPEDLSGFSLQAPEGLLGPAEFDGDNGNIQLTLQNQEIITYSPSFDEDEELVWSCSTTLSAAAIPKGVACESLAAESDSAGGLEDLLGLGWFKRQP